MLRYEYGSENLKILKALTVGKQQVLKKVIICKARNFLADGRLNFYFRMKKKIVYCLMLSFAIVLQTSVLPLLSPAYATGDVLLMLILTGAILDGFFSFLWWAVFAGIVFDLVSYTTVGVHAVIFLFVVYFVSFFSRRFSVELKGVGLLLFMIFVVVATLVSRGVAALLTAWDSQTLSGYFKNFGSFEVLGTQILYNALLFIICFLTFRKIKKFFAIE